MIAFGCLWFITLQINYTQKLQFIDGQFIVRNRFSRKWSVDKQHIVAILRNREEQTITLKTTGADFVIKLSRLSVCSSCALAELTNMQRCVTASL